MNKLFTCAAGVLFAGAAAAADENSGYFLAGWIGASRPFGIHDDKWGEFPSLSGGYSFANGLRPELELAYRYNGKSELQNLNLRAATVLSNLWYEVWNRDGYYFYAGGGIGGLRLSFSQAGVSGIDTGAAWQAGFGFGGALSHNFDWGFAFRHLASFDRISADGGDGPHYMAKSVALELRYWFWNPAPEATSSERAVQVVPVQ
jgi:hypothetical protein